MQRTHHAFATEKFFNESSFFMYNENDGISNIKRYGYGLICYTAILYGLIWYGTVRWATTIRNALAFKLANKFVLIKRPTVSFNRATFSFNLFDQVLCTASAHHYFESHFGIQFWKTVTLSIDIANAMRTTKTKKKKYYIVSSKCAMCHIADLKVVRFISPLVFQRNKFNEDEQIFIDMKWKSALHQCQHTEFELKWLQQMTS